MSEAARPTLVLLHIGKTAGTALRHMLDANPPPEGGWPIRVLSHGYRLATAAARFPEAGVGFFLRDPVDRLVSGFLSRQRQGRPRHDLPWTPDEAKAFARYDTPTAVGEALADGDPEAAWALSAIKHTKEGLAHYLGDPATLERHRDRIAFVGQVETLADDVARLRARYGLPDAIRPPEGEVEAHRTPAHLRMGLSPRAREAIVGWLAPDFAVHRWAVAKRDEEVASGL